MNTLTVDTSSDMAQALAPRQYDFQGGAVDGVGQAPKLVVEGEPEPQAEAAPEAPAPKQAPQREMPDFDQRMQKLSGAQRKLQEERAAIKAERDAHSQEMAEFQRYKELKSRAKEDPVAWAEEGGFKPDEYATHLMEKGSFSPERRQLLEQKRELDELKSWRSEQEQSRKAQEFQGLQNQIMGEMHNIAQSSDGQFDLVTRTGAYPQVLKEIQDHYVSTMDPETGTGETLSYEDAMQRVEDRLVALYSPLLESPKFNRAGSSARSTQAAQPSRKPSATITNKMGGRSAPNRPLTEAEQMERAGQIFAANLTGRRL